MMTLKPAVLILLSVCFSTAALAQEASHVETPTAPATHDAEAALHAGARVGDQPVLPRQTSWAAVMVIVILVGLFLPAAVIGPIVVALVPEEEPETHSHDEPPGASHHYGPSGTVDPHDPHDPHGHPPQHAH